MKCCRLQVAIGVCLSKYSAEKQVPVYAFQLSSVSQPCLSWAFLLSSAYFAFLVKSLSVFNLFLTVGGFPINFKCILQKAISPLRMCPSWLCFNFHLLDGIEGKSKSNSNRKLKFV